MSSKDIDSLKEYIESQCGNAAVAKLLFKMLNPYFAQDFEVWLEGFEADSMSWREYEGTAPFAFDESSMTFSTDCAGQEKLTYEELLFKTNKVTAPHFPLYAGTKNGCALRYSSRRKEYVREGGAWSSEPVLKDDKIVILDDRIIEPCTHEEWVASESIYVPDEFVDPKDSLVDHWLGLLGLKSIVYDFDITNTIVF